MYKLSSLFADSKYKMGSLSSLWSFLRGTFEIECLTSSKGMIGRLLKHHSTSCWALRPNKGILMTTLTVTQWDCVNFVSRSNALHLKTQENLNKKPQETNDRLFIAKWYWTTQKCKKNCLIIFAIEIFKLHFILLSSRLCVNKLNYTDGAALNQFFQCSHPLCFLITFCCSNSGCLFFWKL